MTAEYFTNFESEVLPKVTWAWMFREKKVFGPRVVVQALSEAEHLLITTPGPNLERRKILAPKWFGYWTDLLAELAAKKGSDLVSSESKLIPFWRMKDMLWSYPSGTTTGILFVAGAEGHQGHVHAANYMAKTVDKVIWGFEVPDYLTRKARGGQFLPLELRLSMWFWHPSPSHLTVLPPNEKGRPENEHYDLLFYHSGSRYSFAHENDPFLEEKLRRGEQDLDSRVMQTPVESTTGGVEWLQSPHIPDPREHSRKYREDRTRIIRHPHAEDSTTDDVMKVKPEIDPLELGRRLEKTRGRSIPHLDVPSTTGSLSKAFAGPGSEIDWEAELAEFQLQLSGYLPFEETIFEL